MKIIIEFNALTRHQNVFNFAGKHLMWTSKIISKETTLLDAYLLLLCAWWNMQISCNNVAKWFWVEWMILCCGVMGDEYWMFMVEWILLINWAIKEFKIFSAHCDVNLLKFHFLLFVLKWEKICGIWWTTQFKNCFEYLFKWMKWMNYWSFWVAHVDILGSWFTPFLNNPWKTAKYPDTKTVQKFTNSPTSLPFIFLMLQKISQLKKFSFMKSCWPKSSQYSYHKYSTDI